MLGLEEKLETADQNVNCQPWSTASPNEDKTCIIKSGMKTIYLIAKHIPIIVNRNRNKQYSNPVT